MKLIACDGRRLEVRDVGPVIVELRAPGVPIKAHGTRVVEDAEARALLRELLATGLYERLPAGRNGV